MIQSEPLNCPAQVEPTVIPGLMRRKALGSR